ncbi:MAG: NUDIX domain-containing protein [Spirochaetes bacterium]|nr:NUDIX domain-containing protein [Spirochaetota bacterium]
MKHIRVTAAVMERNGAYLLCRRHPNGELPGKWEFPGGKIENEESEGECLIREIREELSLEVTPRRRLGVVEQELPAGHLSLVAYCADPGSGTPQVLDHEEIAWVSPGELLSYDLATADIEIAGWVAEGACKH